MNNVSLVQGDITTAAVDAIVNAANSRMLGGGGVDGAIHNAAGPALLEACRQVPAIGDVRCPVGEARITAAGKLRARHVIHTVGPRYGIDPDPPRLLQSAYRSTFQLACDNDCRTLAVPAVSCGVYGYPLAEAAEIAIGSAAAAEFRQLDIRFYLFGQEIFDVFNAELKRATGA